MKGVYVFSITLTFSLNILCSCNTKAVSFPQYNPSALANVLSTLPRPKWQEIETQCLAQDLCTTEEELTVLKLQYKKQMISSPESPAGYFLYGRLLGLQDKPEQSVYFFTCALQKDPEYLWAHYGLGIYHLKKQNIAVARIHLMRCLAIDFRFVPALVAMAKIYVNNNDLPHALYYLYCTVRFQPQDPLLKQHLANVLIMDGRHREATLFLREAADLAPENRQILSELAKILIKQKEYGEALTIVQELHRLSPWAGEKKKLQKTIVFLQQMASDSF